MIQHVDFYLSGVPSDTVENGGLAGAAEGSRVWATTVDAPSSDNGINSLLCIVHEDEPWEQIDPDDEGWDFILDLVYVRDSNTLGTLQLFNDSEWRIIPVNS